MVAGTGQTTNSVLDAPQVYTAVCLPLSGIIHGDKEPYRYLPARSSLTPPWKIAQIFRIGFTNIGCTILCLGRPVHVADKRTKSL